MKDIYSMTAAELEAEKKRYENLLREIRRLLKKRHNAGDERRTEQP